MRLEITGTVSPFELQKTVDEAIYVWLKKVQDDNPVVAEMLENDVDTIFTSVTIDLAFGVEETGDWSVLTTDNHEGIPELLVVKAETDDEGNLVWDSVKDNEGDSLFNELEALIAAGLKSDRPKVESKFTDVIPDSGVETVELLGGVDIDIFIAEGHTVVQAYELNTDSSNPDESKLIAEVTFPEEEFDSILKHYQELAEITAE